MGVGADAQQVLALNALAGALRAGATPQSALREARAHVDPACREAWDRAVALAEDGASLGVAVAHVVPAEMCDGVERMPGTELATWLTALAEASTRRWSMARRVGAAVGYPVLVATCAVIAFVAWTAMLEGAFDPWIAPGLNGPEDDRTFGSSAMLMVGGGTVLAALADALLARFRGTIPRWASSLPGGRAVRDSEDLALLDCIALLSALPGAGSRSEQLRSAATLTASRRWASNAEHAPCDWACDPTLRVLLGGWLGGEDTAPALDEVAVARREQIASATAQLQRWMGWVTLLCAAMVVLAAVLSTWGEGAAELLPLDERSSEPVLVAAVCVAAVAWFGWVFGGHDRSRRSASLSDAFAALLTCGVPLDRTARSIRETWHRRPGRRRMRRLLAALEDGHAPARAAARARLNPRFVELLSLWSQHHEPQQVARGWWVARRDRFRPAFDPIYAVALGGLLVLLGSVSDRMDRRLLGAAGDIPGGVPGWVAQSAFIDDVMAIGAVLLGLAGLMVGRALLLAYAPLSRGAAEHALAALVASSLDTGRPLGGALAGSESTYWLPTSRYGLRRVAARLEAGSSPSDAFTAGGFRMIGRACAGPPDGAGDRLRRAVAASRRAQRNAARQQAMVLTVFMLMTAAAGVAMFGEQSIGGVTAIANAIAAWGLE